MQYYITKTGLDAFDTARAWGLGVVLNVITGDEVRITDAEWMYIVEPVSAVPKHIRLSGKTAWASLFQQENWQRVFMTAKGGWGKKRDQAKQIMEQQINSLLANLATLQAVALGSGESLPGGLDPTGFKGLRHTTRARYQEGQFNVPKDHWALASLGMATCGTYRYAKEAGQANWLVLLPVPQEVRFSYFRDVRDLFRLPGLKYHGVQNAAAHYAVQLAERLRRRAAAQGSLQDRYSAVLYFRLFGAGQQLKPAQGNQLRLEPLMGAIARDPHTTQPMLEWLDYCFRLGSTKGAEDLALAATELVMRWDLDAYDRLVRIAVRYQAQGRIRRENLPGSNTLKEVMHHVRV
ncbi:hypothetical protein HRbin10_00180 [bacterium HR10]|nr:hypothetical protein HRbin10_00180 [bacterium HR10]